MWFDAASLLSRTILETRNVFLTSLESFEHLMWTTMGIYSCLCLPTSFAIHKPNFNPIISSIYWLKHCWWVNMWSMLTPSL